MKAATAPRSPILKQFANLWSMQDLPTRETEWSLAEKCRRAKNAGFDAVGVRAAKELPELCAKYGLELICYIDGDMKTFRAKLHEAKAMNPVRINAQICNHDTPPSEAVKVWLKLEAEAEKLGLDVDLEVHRDTCTETPEKVYEIAALYRKATGKRIRFCWDFSHIAVVKHIYPPYADRLLVQPDLVQIARQTHFRPFNGHHCQIPATDGAGHETPEIKPYLEFVDAFFGCWLKAARAGDVLYACPEFGPVCSGYGLSCFPNVWKDAIYLRGKTEELWKKNLRKWKS